MSLKIYHLSELQKQVKLVENLLYPNKHVAQLPLFKVAASPDHTGNWAELWNQFLLTIQKNKSNYNSQTINLNPIFHTSIMNTDFILVIHIELFFSTRTCALQHKTKGVLQEANGVLAHLT